MSASTSYISSGQSRSTLLSSITSRILKRNPPCIDGSMIKPAVQNGSANILKRGRFQPPADVLSAMKTTTGSLSLSTNSISATPGPMPLTFPENASFSRSCPAP